VRTYQHREHAAGSIVLNEARAAHIASEIVDVNDAFGDLVAGFGELQVRDQIFSLR